MRRLPSVALLVVATVLVAAACGGAGKVSEDHVSSCMQDSGKFRHIQTGSQVQYTGSEGGVQAVYTGPDGVTVNVLIGQDAGEASNLKNNLSESGVFTDVNSHRNVVYAVPSSFKDSSDIQPAYDVVKSCL